MDAEQLPYIKAMSDNQGISHDGKSCIFGFKLSDGRTENFVVAGSALGAIISHLRQTAIQCAQAAARDTAAGEPFAAIKKDSILEAAGAEVLARSSPPDPLLRITDSKGIVHTFRLRRELAQWGFSPPWRHVDTDHRRICDPAIKINRGSGHAHHFVVHHVTDAKRAGHCA